MHYRKTMSWLDFKEYSKFSDLNGGVEHLKECFNDLLFEVEHDQVYGGGWSRNEQDLQNLCKKYSLAIKYCNNFFVDNNIELLVIKLCQLELIEQVYSIRKYIPRDIVDKFTELQTDDESDC